MPNDALSLVVGDRVCMEPGIPNFRSKATRLGVYITGGELSIDGRVVNQLSPRERKHRDGVPELRALSAHVSA